jgi:hypothetical protein
LACWENTNLEIIKYLVENQKMNINHTNNNGDNCLTMACWGNINLEIIKYLIENQKMDINYTNKSGNNCLTLACSENTNLEIIKYLVENQKMNINHTNNSGNNCLTLACWENTNLEIIKYLIENQKMNINYVNNYGDNCLTLACGGNTNLEIIRYLIECTNINISLDRVLYDMWEKIMLSITTRWDRFTEIFTRGIMKYDKNKIEKLVKKMNPIMMISQRHLYSTYDICDPFDEKYMWKDFIKHTDDLKFSVPMSIPIPTPCVKEKERIYVYDFTKNDNGLLFMHNNKAYYGHQGIVYDSILCLKEIKEIADFNDPITLSGDMPEYLMNMWIGSMYTKKIDMKNIEPMDMKSFLKHIDQYPTDFLSIDIMEQKFVEYYNAIEQKLLAQYDTSTLKCDIFNDSYLKDICCKYKLKRLYLCIHNKKIDALNNKQQS